MSNFILNDDGSFMSADEIVADLLSREYDEESTQLLLSNFDISLGEDEIHRICIVFARSSFGRMIRNSYGLWSDQNPHVILNPDANAQGIVDHPLHPDNFSGAVMDRFIEAFQQKRGCFTLP